MLFLNHYPQDLIKKHIKIRIEQVKSRQSSNVDTDKQSEIFDEHNAIVLPYFGQISKRIQFMLKKFRIHTMFRIPFGIEALITLGKDVLNRFEKSGVVYKNTKRILGESVITIMFCLIIKKNTLIMTLTGIMLRFCTRKVIREKENL